MEQPEFDTPPVPPPSEQQSTQSSPKVKKKLYGPAGIRLQKTKTVTKTLGPSFVQLKDLTVSCPASHPYAVVGHSEVVEPQYQPGKIWTSHAVAWHAWRAVHQAYELKCHYFGCVKAAVNWTMKLEVLCAQVKPT